MEYQEILFSRPDLQEELEEYAGKLEFSAGYNRTDAEQETAMIMSERYILFKQHGLFDEG